MWLAAADSPGPDATAALALLAQAPQHGLRPADYHWQPLLALRDSLRQPLGSTRPAPRARQLARLEVYLSDAVLRFMRDVSWGWFTQVNPAGVQLLGYSSEAEFLADPNHSLRSRPGRRGSGKPCAPGPNARAACRRRPTFAATPARR